MWDPYLASQFIPLGFTLGAMVVLLSVLTTGFHYLELAGRWDNENSTYTIGNNQTQTQESLLKTSSCFGIYMGPFVGKISHW